MSNEEDRLRSRIIAALESDGVKAYSKCGPIEYGIDILFKKEDAFGVTRNYGVQIKTKSIKLTRGKVSCSAKEIIAQLSAAFGHEFPEGLIDAIYVVCSQEINPFAAEFIKACRIGFREIYFIEKQDLDKYLIFSEAKVSNLKTSR